VAPGVSDVERAARNHRPMTPTPLPETFTPDQREAVRRYDYAAAWSHTTVDGLRIAGTDIRHRADLIDALRTITASDLATLNEVLRTATQRADEEREYFRDFDPMAEINAQRAEEARKAAEFRASPAGRAEEQIRLLQEILNAVSRSR
jgi:hypothetical protein